MGVLATRRSMSTCIHMFHSGEPTWHFNNGLHGTWWLSLACMIGLIGRDTRCGPISPMVACHTPMGVGHQVEDHLVCSRGINLGADQWWASLSRGISRREDLPVQHLQHLPTCSNPCPAAFSPAASSPAAPAQQPPTLAPLHLPGCSTPACLLYTCQLAYLPCLLAYLPCLPITCMPTYPAPVSLPAQHLWVHLVAMPIHQSHLLSLSPHMPSGISLWIKQPLTVPPLLSSVIPLRIIVILTLNTLLNRPLEHT